MTFEQLVLPGLPVPLVGAGTPPSKAEESADRRRTRRQREVIARGVHPLQLAVRFPILIDGEGAAEGRRCGNCRFRELTSTGAKRSYPKCFVDDGVRASHGSGTDVRKWWPACRSHEWGDNTVGPDAARSGPVDYIDSDPESL